jgi:hypothetical protein
MEDNPPQKKPGKPAGSADIQFVYLSSPQTRISAATQQDARSHAARHGHARVRHQRMLEYRQQRNKTQDEQPHVASKRWLHMSQEMAIVRPQVLDINHEMTHHLQNIGLASKRSDIYASYSINLTPSQNYLFHHCG